MANVLVHIELSDLVPTPRSLATLRTGRQIATRLGATLLAVVPRPEVDQSADKLTHTKLSAQGADRVVWVTHPALSTPPLHATHGPALIAAHTRYPAQLILLPSGEGSTDIGARLALEVGGHYAGEARVDRVDGQLSYRHSLQRRHYTRVQALLAASRPLVLSVVESSLTNSAAVGPCAAEVTDIQLEQLDSPLDAITSARPARGRPRLALGAGAGLSARGFTLLRELARLAKAELVASHTACERGIAPAELRVGSDARAVDSDIYVAVAISGSERHLAAIPPGTTLLAINTDSAAPIFDVADYGLVADAEQTIEQLLAHWDSPSADAE